MIRYNKREGVNCCLINFSIFTLICFFCNQIAALELKLVAENQKETTQFLRGNLIGLNRRKNHDPPGFQIFYYVLDNQLQLHKTAKQNQANFSLFLLLFLFLFLFIFSYFCFTRSFSLLPQTSPSLVTTIPSKNLYKG